MPVNIVYFAETQIHKSWMHLMRAFSHGTAQSIKRQRVAAARMRRAGR